FFFAFDNQNVSSGTLVVRREKSVVSKYALVVVSNVVERFYVQLPTQSRPNFFLVGAPKTGTTSLYHYLSQHPQIYMSPVKEPCYFAAEIQTYNLTSTHLQHIRRMSPKLPAPSTSLVSESDNYLSLLQNLDCDTAIAQASCTQP